MRVVKVGERVSTLEKKRRDLKNIVFVWRMDVDSCRFGTKETRAPRKETFPSSFAVSSKRRTGINGGGFRERTSKHDHYG